MQENRGMQQEEVKVRTLQMKCPFCQHIQYAAVPFKGDQESHQVIQCRQDDPATLEGDQGTGCNKFYAVFAQVIFRVISQPIGGQEPVKTEQEIQEEADALTKKGKLEPGTVQ